MQDSSLVSVMLGIASVCLITLTATLLWVTWELTSALRQLRRLVPDTAAALRAAKRVFEQAQEILEHANHTVSQLDALTHRVHQIASNLLQPLELFSGRARAWMAAHGGNGARGEPRSNRRRVSTHRRRTT